MKVPFFSGKFVSRLRESAAVNLPRYESGGPWIEQFAGGQPYRLESRLVVDPPPSLVTSADGNPKHDAENARRVYTWLRQLTPVIAMDERLWSCLSHDLFAEYMRSRWPADSGTAVQRRYLFEGQSFAALSRNGIARLWWAGHLTIDKSRANAFELTDVLFLRQDIQVALLERSFGKCRKVRTAVLEYLKTNNESLAEESFGRRIQVLAREVNLLGGVAILDALPAGEIESFLVRVGKGLTTSTLSQPGVLASKLAALDGAA